MLLTYHRYQDLLVEGDVIIVYNKEKFLHKLISYFTGRDKPRKAGHVAMYLCDKLMAEATSKGIRIKDLKKYRYPKYDLYLGRKKHLTDEEKKELQTYAIKQAGTQYSFLQLLGLIINYFLKRSIIKDVNKKAMICSEFICSSYKHIGKDLVPNKDCALVTPQDLLDTKELLTIKINPPQ